jgi:Trm5-related predicted tRNA methylase
MKREGQGNRKLNRRGRNEILPEYDFSRARPNRYAVRYAQGSNIVVLEPDGAAVFRTEGEVNETLRALAGIIRKHRLQRRVTHRI